MQLKLLKKGDLFNEQSFFTDITPKYTVKSLGFVTLYKIKRSDFFYLIRKSQEDYEKFIKIKDDII